MSRKMVFIGGGENGRILENGCVSKYETKVFDREIVRLTNKNNPNYLFVGHAMYNYDGIEESYYDVMKKIYHDRYGCNTKILKASDLYDRKYTIELVNWADIIYIGGGDTYSLIKLWKETGFDFILKDACDKGKVISGISAGAVCLFSLCNSDCENGFDVVECLGYIDLFITPHCDEVGRYESSKIQLRECNKIGIMLSNCSAIEIIDNKYRILTEYNYRNNSYGYVIRCYYDNYKYYEEILLNNNYRDIRKLFDRNIK